MRIIEIDKTTNMVICVKELSEDYVLQENEIQSNSGELGQLLQEDGTFINPQSTQINLETTLEDKINYIYYKQMGVI